jgi:periplasmic protein TonB
MFTYIIESPSPVGHRKRNAYVPLSIATHLVLVAAAVVVPLFAPNVLPAPATTLMAFISRDVQPPPAPAAPLARASSARSEAPPNADTNPFAAPVVSPATVAPEGVGEMTKGLIQGVEGGVGNVLDGALGTRVDLPPPPPPRAEPDEPRRVGGIITKPTKIHDVMPVYPAIAQSSRVSGLVIIEATIGPRGDVLDAAVLRGHPLLDAAALNAVRQWRFTPTLLNGKAIAVVMTVTVDFKLR